VPVREPVDEPVQATAEDRREDEQEQQYEPDRQATGEADQRQRGKAAEHEQIAVREVDQLDDAVHHRVAQRNQRDNHAVGQPDDELLQKYFPASHADRYFSDADTFGQPPCTDGEAEASHARSVVLYLPVSC